MNINIVKYQIITLILRSPVDNGVFQRIIGNSLFDYKQRFLIVFVYFPQKY